MFGVLIVQVFEAQFVKDDKNWFYKQYIFCICICQNVGFGVFDFKFVMLLEFVDYVLKEEFEFEYFDWFILEVIFYWELMGDFDVWLKFVWGYE